VAEITPISWSIQVGITVVVLTLPSMGVVLVTALEGTLESALKWPCHRNKVESTATRVLHGNQSINDW